MRADPIPKHTSVDCDAKGAISAANAHRALGANFLVVQGRMKRIFLEQFEILVRDVAHGNGQFVVCGPKVGRSEMIQIALAFPA